MEKRAEEFAREKHKGQVRKFNGEPYVNHPIRVRDCLREFTESESILCAALLHDTLEDTETSVEDLREIFGEVVANLVVELTSDKEEIKVKGKGPYLTEKMSAMSSDAFLIKLADRLDNVSDLSLDELQWSADYVTQTLMILNNIKRVIPNSHQTLMVRISTKIHEFSLKMIEHENNRNMLRED